MKRSPSATRSYLQQLADPIPQPAALLIPRRPAERGASPQSAFDAIPTILDSVSDPRAEAVTPRYQAANAARQKEEAQTSNSRALPIDLFRERAFAAQSDIDSESAPNAAKTARPQKRTVSTMPSTDEALPRPHTMIQENPSSREPLSLQDNAVPQSEDRKQSFTETPSTTARIASKASAHAEPNLTARDQSNSGIRVHIGTIEIRAAAPVREPKPAPAIDRSVRTGRPGVAEPLSRGLAWSYGLVQG